MVWADTVLAANRPPAAAERPKNFLRSICFSLRFRDARAAHFRQGLTSHHRGISPFNRHIAPQHFLFRGRCYNRREHKEPPMTIYPGRFANRTAIVTGGASGLGLETAKRITAEGGKVCLWDMNPQSLAAAKAATGA